MEQILRSVLVSQHPLATKKALVTKLTENKPSGNACRGLFALGIEWTGSASDSVVSNNVASPTTQRRQLGSLVVQRVALHDPAAAAAFITPPRLFTLLTGIAGEEHDNADNRVPLPPPLHQWNAAGLDVVSQLFVLLAGQPTWTGVAAHTVSRLLDDAVAGLLPPDTADPSLSSSSSSPSSSSSASSFTSASLSPASRPPATPRLSGALARLLLAVPGCRPRNVKGLAALLLAWMLHMNVRTADGKYPGKDTVEHVEKTAELLGVLWQGELAGGTGLLATSAMRAAFAAMVGSGAGTDSKVSTPSRAPRPSPGIAAMLARFPESLMSQAAQHMASRAVNDHDLITALREIMLVALRWPAAKGLYRWVIAFLKALAAEKRFPALIRVTQQCVKGVFQLLLLPECRANALPVVQHLLLSYQHAPDAFHAIVPIVPAIVRHVRHEDEAGKQPQHQPTVVVLTLTTLLHALMFQFSGFPELYEPVLRSLEGLPVTPETRIKRLLADKAWWNSAPSSSSTVSGSAVATRDTLDVRPGLVNLGNTCFMNSMVQALYSVRPFRNAALLHRQLTKQRHPVTLETKKLFTLMMASHRQAISPTGMRDRGVPSWFPRGTQQDCSEFVKFLLGRVEDECKPPKAADDAPGDASGDTAVTSAATTTASAANTACPTPQMDPSKTFRGTMCTEYRCDACGTSSMVREPFNDLALAFPDGGSTTLPSATVSASPKQDSGGGTNGTAPTTYTVSLPSSPPPLHINHLISYCLQPEKLCGSNKYFCNTCDTLQDAHVQRYVSEAPETLMLTLLRFAYDPKAKVRRKIFREVNFEPFLDLPVRPERAEGQEDDGADADVVPGVAAPEPTDGTNVRYTLCAAVVHSGNSANGGHYFSYVADLQPAAESEKGGTSPRGVAHTWWLCNDSRVSPTSYESLSKITARFPRDTAYALFYRRVDTIAWDAEQTSVLAMDEQQMAWLSRDNDDLANEQKSAKSSRTPSSATSSPWPGNGHGGAGGGTGGSATGGGGLGFGGGGGGFGGPPLVS
eukprot:m.176643 g.176643  ORF g.176643 m.176643 type:complete len:1029 (+) comp17948_c0_seq2:228-3314(+)